MQDVNAEIEMFEAMVSLNRRESFLECVRNTVLRLQEIVRTF